MIEKKKELAKKTFIIGIGKLCTQFMSFFLLPLYTAALSTSEYGLVDVINTYVSLLMPIFTLQLEQGIFRFLIDAREDKKRIKEITSTVISLMILISLVYSFLITVVGIFFDIQYSQLLLLNLLAIGFSNILLQIVRGLGNNIVYSIGSFITALTTILFNIAFILFLHCGTAGMLFSTVLANTVCCIYLIWAEKIYSHYSICLFEKKLLKDLLKYSIPLIPNTISWWIVSASDRTIVSCFLGVASNGILSIAHKFSSVYSIIYNIFNLTWTESAALYMDEKDGEAYMNEVLRTVFNLFTAANMCIIACMPFVFSYLVDPSYYNAYHQIPIQMLASLFNVIAGLYSVVYVAKKLTNEIAKTTILAAAINISIHLILIKFTGLYAASFSSLIAYIVLALIREKDTQKYKRLKIPKKSIIVAIFVYSIIFTGYYSKIRSFQIIVLVVTVIYAININIEFIKSCIVEIINKIKQL